MRWDVIGLAAAALIILGGVILKSPDPDRLRFEVDGTDAYGYGYTDGRSETAIDRLLRDHPDVDTLVFIDMPGTRDVTSNYRLARDIRRAGLATELRAGSRIASGAVDLFLAGQSRTVACGAKIGVHAWGSSGFDAQDVRWDTHRRYSRDFLSDMGVDADFYDFRTNAAGSDDIHWMSVEEINHWRVASAPLICDSA